MCKATMNCGRHTCGERCCPGERKAIERQATKRKLKSLNIVSRPSDNDIEAEHICTRICGRMLKCSTHTCPELCHKGPCEKRCNASRDKIRPSQSPTSLKCDEECGRLERNRTLASALNVSIDPQTTSAANPSTQTASTLPYSEETLDLYLKLSTSSTLSTLQTYQSTLHSLATSQTQRSARFPPARSQLRAFVHSLAADWGFKSESFDPEPHRHVLVFKSASWLPPHLGAAIPGSPGIGIGGLTVGDCAKMRDRERMREREAKRLAAAAAEKLKAESHGAGDFDAAAGGGGWAQVASRKRATGPAESPFGFGELSGPSGPAKAGTLVLRSGVGKGRGAASGAGVGGGRYPPGFGDDVVDDWEEEVEKEEREREREQGQEQGQKVEDDGVESKSDDAVVAEVAVGNQAEQV
ncbi:FKBP12-associated protein [Emmonsiellopsis sp. PD_33]|nr:FKBP12-associated protein [Emmonsiellopsis sp. PD_33]